MVVEQQLDQNRNSISSSRNEAENLNGSFDCNICLDSAQEPVITLCGHLYCWSCIFKWFHYQSASLPSDEYPQCPICKAEISHTTLIPLYGRGQSPTNPESPDYESKNPSTSQGNSIPPRPPACRIRALLNDASQPQPPSYGPEDVVSSSSSSFNHSDAVGDVFQPVVGMFGEMVYSRVFGNSRSLYTYPDSYNVGGSTSPRLRRQEIQVDKSLNRVSLFLVCCFFLCLFLF